MNIKFFYSSICNKMEGYYYIFGVLSIQVVAGAGVNKYRCPKTDTCTNISTANLLFIRSLALRFVKDNLAHTHGLGCYLYIFVFLDILQCFF